MELIVSFAIFGVISLTLVGLISSSMEYYRRISSTVNLQYEYQIVMTQIREYAINCNGAIFFGNNTLYILNVDGDDLTANVFIFDAANTRLTYEERSFGTLYDPADDWDSTANPGGIGGVLSENIEVFRSIGTFGPATTDLTLEMTFANGTGRHRREYLGEQTIAMRNAPFDRMLEEPLLLDESQRTLMGFLSEINGSRS
jgi:hypothetical protein